MQETQPTEKQGLRRNPGLPKHQHNHAYSNKTDHRKIPSDIQAGE